LTPAPGAPTTMVLPAVATELPKPSFIPVSEPTSSASSHPAAVFVKTYARPALEAVPSRPKVPTTIALPEIETEPPKPSLTPVSGATNLAVCRQPDPVSL
jgi:hypothetical protein